MENYIAAKLLSLIERANAARQMAPPSIWGPMPMYNNLIDRLETSNTPVRNANVRLLADDSDQMEQQKLMANLRAKYEAVNKLRKLADQGQRAVDSSENVNPQRMEAVRKRVNSLSASDAVYKKSPTKMAQAPSNGRAVPTGSSGALRDYLNAPPGMAGVLRRRAQYDRRAQIESNME